jgi:hypothetical protein
VSPRNIVIHLPWRGQFTEADFIAYANVNLVQVCRLEIVRPHERMELELHFAHGDLGPHDVNALELTKSVAALILPVSDGLIRGAVRPENSALLPEVAAAIAVVQASWAWDERESFVVLVNGKPFTVAPRFRAEGMWDVGLSESGLDGRAEE